MGKIQDNLKLIQEVAKWSDAGAEGPVPTIPSNVTGNPPVKPVANMARDDAQKSADHALKRMKKFQDTGSFQ